MNDLAKNLLLWVIIAVVLMAVFNSFSPRTPSAQAMAYDEFVQQVQSDRIAKVKIDADNVSISGERASTVSRRSTERPQCSGLQGCGRTRLVPAAARMGRSSNSIGKTSKWDFESTPTCSR